MAMVGAWQVRVAAVTLLGGLVTRPLGGRAVQVLALLGFVGR
jgi:hypothetical protein